MFNGMKKILRRHSLHLGMTLLVFFVAIEVAGYLKLGDGAASPASSAEQMLLIGMAGSISVILLLAVYLQMTLYGPVKFLSREVKRMADRDFISLSFCFYPFDINFIEFHEFPGIFRKIKIRTCFK